MLAPDRDQRGVQVGRTFPAQPCSSGEVAPGLLGKLNLADLARGGHALECRLRAHPDARRRPVGSRARCEPGLFERSYVSRGSRAIARFYHPFTRVRDGASCDRRTVSHHTNITQKSDKIVMPYINGCKPKSPKLPVIAMSLALLQRIQKTPNWIS